MSVPSSMGDAYSRYSVPLVGYSIKILIERALALVLLLVFAPLLILCAILVRIDSPGPVFFRQPRYGQGNRPFDMFKFRTMHHASCDPTGRDQTADGDARITRVGWVLRVTSLDELPQLINVVRGDMALVGPRAHPCGMEVEGVLCEVALPGYARRHRVKPGITGLAQVSGSRGRVRTVEELVARVDMDNRYIDEWSAGLDARILLRTVGVVLRGTGA